MKMGAVAVGLRPHFLLYWKVTLCDSGDGLATVPIVIIPLKKN